MESLSDGPSLASLIDAVDVLAVATGCPIVVEDHEYRVMAYSAVDGQSSDPTRDAAILQRRTTEAWLTWASESGVEKEVLESPDPVQIQIPGSGLKQRRVKAIRWGERHLGFIWVLEGQAGFPASLNAELALFEHHARVEIARLGRLATASAESQLVRRLISAGFGRREDLLAEIGVGPEWYVRVTVLAHDRAGYVEAAVLQEMIHRAREAYGGSRQHRVAVGMIERDLCRLDFFESRPTISDGLLMAQVSQEVRRALGSILYVGCGSLVPAVEITGSYEEARWVVEALRETSAGSALASIDHLRSLCALLEVRSVTRTGGAFAALGRSLGLDDDLRETLRVLLRNERSVSRAAAELNLHPNSLRYRLEKISRQLPLDLEQPVDRLVLELLLFDWDALDPERTSLID